MSEAAALSSTYAVVGMACRGCAAAVTEEVELIDGVTSVAVDIESGTVTVTSHEALAAETVRFAVEEAGYRLAGPRS